MLQRCVAGQGGGGVVVVVVLYVPRRVVVETRCGGSGGGTGGGIRTLSMWLPPRTRRRRKPPLAQSYAYTRAGRQPWPLLLDRNATLLCASSSVLHSPAPIGGKFGKTRSFFVRNPLPARLLFFFFVCLDLLNISLHAVAAPDTWINRARVYNNKRKSLARGR